MNHFVVMVVVLLVTALAPTGPLACQPQTGARPRPAAVARPASPTPASVPDDSDEEHLGPRDSDPSSSPPGPHPLDELRRTQISSPRPQLAGKHPRIFFGAAGLEKLRQRATTTHRERWASVLDNLRVFNSRPPKPPAQARRSQNVVGLAIAEAALAWSIEREPKYLTAAKTWMDYATSYDVWGYAYSKPNVDLAAGHLLYGMGWAYDLLYHDLSEAERHKYRTKIIRQARLLYTHFEPKPGRTYAYSQNHVYIPAAGLAVAAYALHGEVPEAASWASLARAILGRSLDTYSADGYFYESFEYFVFAIPWLVQYVTAHAHFTGEPLWDRPGFRQMHKYLAHIVLPDGKHVFDFGDAFSGADTRTGKSEDLERTHPGGKLHSNYTVLYAMADWFQDPLAQGVANHMRTRGDSTWYDYMSLLWYEPSIRSEQLDLLPTYHYFADHELVFYRTQWSADATAVAFKCGPPEGHATWDRQQQFPDWHLSSGHAHPDANSFILYGKGQYLTGDSGYSGVPRTDQHNTFLINGRGQRLVPTGHNAFKDIPYERLNELRLEVVSLGPDTLEIVGHAQSAYDPGIGLKSFTRRLSMISATEFKLDDSLETTAPSTFTALFHSDRNSKQLAPGHFSLEQIGASVRVLVRAPIALSTAIEPNWMTAPGRPGSVQKGDRESRGTRLRVSNKAAAQTAAFSTRLTIH